MLVIVRKLIGVLSILAGFGLLALLLLMMSTNRSVSALLLPGLFLIGGLWLFGGILADVGDRPGRTILARRPVLQADGDLQVQHHLGRARTGHQSHDRSQ